MPHHHHPPPGFRNMRVTLNFSICVIHHNKETEEEEVTHFQLHRILLFHQNVPLFLNFLSLIIYW